MKPFTEVVPFRVRTAGSEEPEVLFSADEVIAKEEELLRAVEALPPGGLLPVDFEGVRISSEAARALLRRALRRLASGEIEDRYLVLERLGPSHYNVGLMLKGEGLTAVERRGEGVAARLIGRVEEAVRQTYEFLLGRDTATARDLQEYIGLSHISTATNRLTGLARLALARRVAEETVAGGGRQFVYAALR